MTISLHGGEWFAGSWTGVTYRFVTTVSDVYDSYGSVASSNVENMRYYSDIHEVDEDVITGLIHGGSWHYENNAGAVLRYANVSPFYPDGIVASLKNKNSLSQ